MQHYEATKNMLFIVAIWCVTTCQSCSWARPFRGQTVEPHNPTGLGYRHYTHINHRISWQCNQVSKTCSPSHSFFLLAWQVQLGKTDTPQCLCSTSKPQMCVCVYVRLSMRECAHTRYLLTPCAAGEVSLGKLLMWFKWACMAQTAFRIRAP